jgi:hypothetical protein
MLILNSIKTAAEGNRHLADVVYEVRTIQTSDRLFLGCWNSDPDDFFATLRAELARSTGQAAEH